MLRPGRPLKSIVPSLSARFPAAAREAVKLKTEADAVGLDKRNDTIGAAGAGKGARQELRDGRAVPEASRVSL